MTDPDPVENRCVIRLRTTTWSDTKGIHIKRSLTFLRRHCIGYNILEEDTHAVGVKETVMGITNLNECEDGIYEVVVCNEIRDWESGYLDYWDYKLVPYTVGQAEINNPHPVAL